MITYLEPDILECEVRWALGSISMNKASGDDGISAGLVQILKEVKVSQLCLTLCISEILQARILEWVIMPFSRGSSQPRDWTQSSCTAGAEPPRKAILKDDAVKVLQSICQQIWKTQQWLQDWKRSGFIPIPKKGSAKECSNYCTIALISHTNEIMLKILQATLQQYFNQELPDVQAGFRKDSRTRD